MQEFIDEQWVNCARAAQNGCKRAQAALKRNPAQAAQARGTLASNRRNQAIHAQSFATFNAQYALGM